MYPIAQNLRNWEARAKDDLARQLAQCRTWRLPNPALSLRRRSGMHLATMAERACPASRRCNDVFLGGSALNRRVRFVLEGMPPLEQGEFPARRAIWNRNFWLLIVDECVV